MSTRKQRKRLLEMAKDETKIVKKPKEKANEKPKAKKKKEKKKASDSE